MKIISWNVNGFRAVVRKAAFDWVDKEMADILCFQEVKADIAQAQPFDEMFKSYQFVYWNSSQIKKGYSGVAIFSKEEPLNVIYGINNEEFDHEGRVIEAEFKDFTLFNIYFPNSGMEGRMDVKLRFNKDVQKRVKTLLDGGKNVIVTGDYNVAHKEIDIARPKENDGKAGFTQEERFWMDEFLDETKCSMIDTFRYLHPTEKDRYSWWNMRFGARAKNIGWRIDYFTINKGLVDKLIDADIYDQIMGSDHAPLMISLKN